MTYFRRMLRLGLLGNSLVFDDLAEGQTFVFVASPHPVVKAWVDSGNPTVRVEKGWGSGDYADLYPDLSGGLWTGAYGTGQTAAAYAGSSKLLVERIYNQAGSNPASDYVSAISANLRVLLGLSPTPHFAGYSTGTQDANQHATQRGYALPSTVKIKTNTYPFSIISAIRPVNGEDVYLIQDTVSAGNAYFRIREANADHFVSHAVVAGLYPSRSDPIAFVAQQVAFDNSRGIATDYSQRAAVSGVYFASNMFSSSSTERLLNMFGPTNALQGKCYALMISMSDLSETSVRWGGIPTNLGRTYMLDIDTDEPNIAFPYANAVVPMDLDTETADIPIKLIGKPSTAYEARWQAGSYVGIGTSDAYGVLDGAMAGQAKGNGTLDVRQVGGSTPVSIANVAVGIVVYAMGESETDGRGSNVTITIPAGSLRRDRANWTAASNEYWKLFLQNLYDDYSCVIGVTKVSGGSTYFRNISSSLYGNWSTNISASVSPALAAQGLQYILGMQGDFLTPNFFLWDIGKNDASLQTTGASFKTEFTALLNWYRTETGNVGLTFAPILSGDNGLAGAAYVDAIRQAQIELWETSGFTPAGSFAHLLGDLDGTHFDSQAQKQKAADILSRYLVESVRAPRYLSANKSGADLIITFTGGVSPLTISGTLSTDDNGWSISDGNGARTITGMSVAGLVLTITLDQALSGTVTFSFGSNDSAIGGTLLDSHATTPLPPEPFYSASV